MICSLNKLIWPIFPRLGKQPTVQKELPVSSMAVIGLRIDETGWFRHFLILPEWLINTIGVFGPTID